MLLHVHDARDRSDCVPVALEYRKKGYFVVDWHQLQMGPAALFESQAKVAPRCLARYAPGYWDCGESSPTGYCAPVGSLYDPGLHQFLNNFLSHLQAS